MKECLDQSLTEHLENFYHQLSDKSHVMTRSERLPDKRLAPEEHYENCHQFNIMG